MATSVKEVIDSFESSFRDKCEIPLSLELVWLKKAIARYNIELSEITFDEKLTTIDGDIDQYTIDTLAAFMKQLYQERELSKVNKRVSIVSKDLSVNGNGAIYSAARNELDYVTSKAEYMIEHQMPTAYT